MPTLDAERTDLAWNRSSLSLIACGAAILRGLGRQPLVRANVAVGVCVIVLGGLTWLLEAWGVQQVRRRGARRATAADLRPITLGVAAVGVAAFVLCAFAPG